MMKFSLSSLSLFSLAIFASVSALAASPQSYGEAKALADRDEASLDQTGSAALLEAQGRQLGAAVANCADPNADLSPLVVVVELDARGKIIGTWRQGETTFARCFEREMPGRYLMPPPRVPFYSSFEVSFTK